MEELKDLRDTLTKALNHYDPTVLRVLIRQALLITNDIDYGLKKNKEDWDNLLSSSNPLEKRILLALVSEPSAGRELLKKIGNGGSSWHKVRKALNNLKAGGAIEQVITPKRPRGYYRKWRLVNGSAA